VQEFFGMVTSLGVEGVRNDATGNLVTRFVGATDAITTISGKRRRTTDRNSNPDICGMLRSEMITSEARVPSCRRASNPCSAVRTTYPADLSSIEVLSRILASSSTIRT
jgi:hypothetical protein